MIPLTWFIGGLAGIALIASAAGYMTGYSKGYSARGVKCEAQVAQIVNDAEAAKRKFQDEINDTSIAYEALRSERIVRTQRTINTVREIYKNVEVAASCEPPAAAIGVLNTEVLSANAAATGKSVR